MIKKRFYVTPQIAVFRLAEEPRLLHSSFGGNGNDGNGHNAADDDNTPIGAAKQGWFDDFEEEEEEDNRPYWGI